MDFSIADCADISELVRMRIDYIKADQGNVSIENELAMRNNLPIYFEKHMGKDLFIFVAKADNQIISTAFLLIVEKPSNPHFMNGRIGEVLNVYTMRDF